MAHKNMTFEDVRKYYGGRYKVILDMIGTKETLKNSTFDIDLSCGEYLELSTTTSNGYYFKVNHGINNSFPYNSWIKNTKYYFCELERLHHKSQKDLASWIDKKFK